MKLAVSGTDTDVGKTVFAAGLCGLLGLSYWKPVQAGEPGDRETVEVLSGQKTLPEKYRLKLPASPHQSAADEGLTIDTDALVPPDGDMVIEGAGGLMVPLTRQTLFIDVFARWKLPLVLCARTKLGTINHTLLSIEAVRARGIPLVGVAFIGDGNPESEGIIAEKAGVKRLGRLPFLETLNRDTLATAMQANFKKSDFA